MISFWLLPLFFVVALLYSMAGFGGGSSYIALLALFGASYQIIPITALSCNLVVTLLGSTNFYRAGHLRTQLVLPFLVSSMPTAFFAATLRVSKQLFLLLLAIALTVAAAHLLFSKKQRASLQPLPRHTSLNLWAVALPAGVVFGGFAGIVGIGGGIFLAPFLYLIGWGTAQQIAAASAVFIFLNSVAGIAGQLTKLGTFPSGWTAYLWLPVVVAIGGGIGSRIAARRLPALWIQRVTAVLIAYVAYRLWQQVFAS